MLDERNGKRRAKIKEAQSLQIRVVNAVVLNISNQESLQQNDTLSSIPYQSFVLKDCPPCTYCNARRFQYEPLGFCCSSGQVVLVSNEMPSLLKQLFCEKR
nr:Phosphoenolpyruvate/phosphate translocator 1, chloroplastic [Ipomoea batatas]